MKKTQMEEVLQCSERRIIANVVEIIVCNTNGYWGSTDVIDDFFDYLDDQNLLDYWTGFEAIPCYTNTGDNEANAGAKFVFTRTVKGNGVTDSETMGGGTQWTSDVVELMKGFLAWAKKSDSDFHSEHYRKTRLVFRIDGKQFEWK